MKIREPYSTAYQANELPHVLRLENHLYAASFSLMKLLPARFILERAHDAGLIEKGSTVIETTSGTFGLALAMVCAVRGYQLILVSDPAIDEPLKRRLEDLGTRVEIVSEPARVGGFQQARLDRMSEIQAQHPGYFCPSQYDNPHNPCSYGPLAELLAEEFNQIDYLVGAVGSGGSMCGTSNYLRLLFPQIRVIGVDTFGSVLFGQPDRHRLLRGLGNSLMPANLDHSTFDEVHWVSAGEAFFATRQLHRKHALFMGGTSGAAYMVAQWCAARNPDATVVCLLPDQGYRYIETIYRDDWLKQQGVWLEGLPVEPKLALHPLEAGPDWSYMLWNRRTREQVLASIPVAGTD